MLYIKMTEEISFLLFNNLTTINQAVEATEAKGARQACLAPLSRLKTYGNISKSGNSLQRRVWQLIRARHHKGWLAAGTDG